MLNPTKLSQNAKAVDTVEQAVALGATVIEPKLDGWRILAHVHEDGVELYSRAAKKYGGSLPHIEARLAELFPPDTWIDGEVIAPVGWGDVQSALGSNTDKAARRSAPLTYCVFDLLAHGGIDARALPLSQRRELLAKVLVVDGTTAGSVRLVEQLPASQVVHDQWVAAGVEGSIVKDPTKPYGSGKRGHGWYKIKRKYSLDAILTRFEEGTGSNAGQAGVMVFSQWRDGELVERGKCKILGDAFRAEINANLEQYLGQVVEIQHMGRMKDGIRHPQFLRFRPDKAADEVEYHDT